MRAMMPRLADLEPVGEEPGLRAIVLVVEDEPAQAGRVLRRVAPDLVVVDRELPDGDGSELLQRLRRDGAFRSLPVVMVTGRDAPGQETAFLDGGADDYLVKPFGSDRLLARLRAVLRRSYAQRWAEVTLLWGSRRHPASAAASVPPPRADWPART